MKLSEAIRIGSKQTKKTVGQYIARDSDGDDVACAVGAACYAVGFKSNDTRCIISFFEDTFPILKGFAWGSCCWICGVSEERLFNLSTMIFHLNDMHDWSREAIAEWVETIEKKIEAKGDDRGQESGVNQTPAPVVPEEIAKEVYPVEVR